MTAEPAGPLPPNTVEINGEKAVVIPMYEYRLLKTLKDRAAPEEIEAAEFEAAIAEHEAWEAAGSPGGYMSHEQAMAVLLRGQ